MANKFYNYRVRAAQTAAANPMPQGGTGYLDFTNTGSYNQFDSVVNISAGSEERFVYRITAASEASKYEYGIGYITSVSSDLRLTREKTYSSSQSDNSRVAWATVDGALTLDMMVPNPNYVSRKRLSFGTSATHNIPNLTTTYLLTASGNMTLNLPLIESNTDSVAIDLMITDLSGSQNSRSNAVTLDASGSNTINSTGTYVLTKKNDLVKLISDTDNTNWIVLDPENDTAGSDGSDGAVQLASGGSLSSDTGLFFKDNALFIGGSGTSDASIQLTESNGATFNLQSGSIDFAVHSNGAANTLFVDGSTNRVGLRTNSPLDILHVNTTGVGGIMVSNTGSGGVPVATFKNSDTNSTDGTDVGRIDFIGIDSASNDTTYVRILAEVADETNASEEGQLDFLVNHNGTLQPVAKLTYDDLNIGTNNSVSGGLVVGSSNTNKGENVVIGFSNTNCGNTSIAVGHSNTITSGSYGGAFGKNHTVTGSHMWLFGGSGFDVTGNNTTYLVGNSNNYIKVKHDDQERICIYVDTTGTDFNIINSRVSTTGVEHKQNFVFNNSDGVSKTGVSYGIEVTNPASGSESTKFFIQTLETGVLTDVLRVSPNNVNISNVSGFDNSVLVGNSLTITGTGNNTVVVGMSNTLTANSGNNVVVGYNNELSASGNNNTALLGNSNTVDENYTSTVGTSNRNSGLYSAVIGYNNGIYGENIGAVGVNNSVSGNNSSVLGYNNNIDHNSVYVVGQGNTAAYSGVTLIGNNITATGSNHTIIKNDVVIITGTTVRFDANVEIGNNTAISSGDNISVLTNDAGYITGEAYVTGITYTTGLTSGLLVLSHHSGTTTGVLTNVMHSGTKISFLTNDSNYVASGSNVSQLTNDSNYIDSSGFAVPKLTFTVTYDGLNNRYTVSGAGTTGQINPDLYLHRGVSYDFKHVGAAGGITIMTGAGGLGNYAPYNLGVTNNTGEIGGTTSWTVRHDTPIVHDSGTGLWNVPSAANSVYITGRYLNSGTPSQGGNIFVV